MFEVALAGEIVWEYINPHHGEQRPGVFANWVFRAYRYAADSQEIRGRLASVGALNLGGDPRDEHQSDPEGLRTPGRACQ